MIYLYTPDHALTLPARFRCGRGISPEVRFTWEGPDRVRVSLGEDAVTLPLRSASALDRRLAVNRDGWCYVPPFKS